MRVPHYQTIEPYQYDPGRHDALYGSDSHRWLSSGYMGHLLCFPVFGPPSSPAEVKNGLLEGQRVILYPVDSIDDGVSVRIVPESHPN
jgi:hypothetical protein